MFELYLVLVLFIIGLAAYGISNVIYKRLARTGYRYATAIRISAFILSFAVILFGAFLLLIYNIRIER
jgi:hypothetical protein